MDKISIDILFPDTKSKNKVLDVETLFPYGIGLNNRSYLDVDELTYERKKKQLELHCIYKQIMEQCINEIKVKNELDQTDMMFIVPNNVFMYPKYNSIDCLKYIERKLRKQYLDTYITSHNQMFISWFNIEKNKEIDKVIKKHS
jgi:hypothetical protein